MTKNNRSIRMLLVALGAAVLWPVAAGATLDLDVNVFKNKDVEVNIDVTITKTIDVTVNLDEQFQGSAEAWALANVENTFNQVGPCQISCENGFDPDSFGIELSATIDGSVLDNDGIVNVNQDVGNMVNQANLLSFARVEFPAPATGVDPSQIASDAQAEVDQLNAFNSALQEEIFADPVFSDPDHDATIVDSISNNNGVVGVNQNTGNMNNQTNAVAMVVGAGNAVVLTEAALGQENSNNFVEGVETVKVNMIDTSINNNNGVVSLNQSSGNMNNQGSAIAFGALKSTATIVVPGT